jgi:ABC-type lipoprotein release transport system permease subunit
LKELVYTSIAGLLTSLGAALFPALRAARIKPVEALRHY